MPRRHGKRRGLQQGTHGGFPRGEKKRTEEEEERVPKGAGKHSGEAKVREVSSMLAYGKAGAEGGKECREC